jgi:RNA polymerase sigma-70 factor (ECF subfamily)
MPPEAPSASSTDDALLADMAQGDERALAVLYDRHATRLMAVAFRITGNRADAESVVLETFTQAWRDAARFTVARGSVGTWLVTIVRSRALDLVRATTRRERVVQTHEVVPDAPAPVTVESGPHAALEQRERERAIAQALETLPGAQRLSIELAFFEGLSHSEISERLGEPLGTVKTRIRIGMKRLRDVLQPFAAEGHA